MKYQPTITRTIHETGTQHIFVFPNGYGASVVRHRFSYGNALGLWELAVIAPEKDPNRFAIVYDTPVSSDVIGHLDWDEVGETLAEIEALPPRTEKE